MWLAEADVATLATPADAVPVIEDSFRRMSSGQVELMPRRRFAIDGGYFAVMAAADRGLGVAGLKSYTLVNGSLVFVVCLFDLATGALTATVEADRLGQIRTGAASGAAAKHLARSGSTSIGLIGAGGRPSHSSPQFVQPFRRSSARSSPAGHPSGRPRSPSGTMRSLRASRPKQAPVTLSSR